VTAALAGTPIKLLRGEPLVERTVEPPGSVLGLRESALAVACGGGSVLGLERLQRPGKKPLRADELLRGERLTAGARFS
jgi:methionyl-tRNA formyltransferase